MSVVSDEFVLAGEATQCPQPGTAPVTQRPPAALLSCSYDGAADGSARWNLSFKRIFDVVLSLALILFLLPVFLLLAAAILIEDGRPFLYRHRRVGRNGREFDCLKIRSMVKDADARLQALIRQSGEHRREWEETQKLREDPRILAVGHVIRKLSLDELPQLFNVLRGDMSLVGPRPIVRQEVARYGEAIEHYLAVRPGITGLWQVSGRSGTSYAERVAMDVAYVRTRRPSTDLRILLRTVVVVASARDSY
ncbi:sugar transferase [Aureimonas sp. SK2]|uniref:sugar transferase n=1 Tax=Aureimonas sp. SK2 TaxID=3015992 RepID=UPI002444EB5E|nr:sugar transferase [Aureimonas sp. SK2]